MLFDAQSLCDMPGFDVPTEQQLVTIKPGCNVKVTSNGERFWVFVKATADDGSIIGLIDNDLVMPPNRARWRRGDTIKLQQRHVLDIKVCEDRDVFIEKALAATPAWIGHDVIVPVDGKTNTLQSVDDMCRVYMFGHGEHVRS